jgi:hypothetical protein
MLQGDLSCRTSVSVCEPHDELLVRSTYLVYVAEDPKLLREAAQRFANLKPFWMVRFGIMVVDEKLKMVDLSTTLQLFLFGFRAPSSGSSRLRLKLSATNRARLIGPMAGDQNLVVSGSCGLCIFSQGSVDYETCT